MALANKVEGLVDFTVRGGSSPLGRINSLDQRVISCLALANR